MPPSSPDPDPIQVATPELEDYRWLAGDDANPFLARAMADGGSTVALVQKLRKALSPARTHLVVAQAELRARARQKFGDAAKMLFTRKLLEQATDEQSGEYKASRFPRNATTLDLCCGMGGDLIALADRGSCTGIDRDPIAALLADANCRALNRAKGIAQVGDARDPQIDAGVLWHIDPDRRAHGKRSTRAEFFEPDLDALGQLVERHPDGAIKLAPATVVPEHLAPGAEFEWIGRLRSCQQQVVWLGNLARLPASRTATVLGRRAGEAPVSIHGQPNQEIPLAATLGNYLHEPHAAVLASRLTGALAAALQLEAVTHNVAYLTSGLRIEDDPRLATFEVIAAMPFDVKQVKSLLRARRMGRIEIKHRGLQLDPDLLRKQLRVPGDRNGCLVIVGGRTGAQAVLTKRCADDENDGDA